LRLSSERLKPEDKTITIALEECDLPPTYYTVDELAERLKVATPAVKDVIGSLRARGFRAARTVFNPKGVRTDAPKEAVEEAVLSLK
jgi:tRNA (guanine26-N2/guanine27-N2)-dimethyltransferase